jgi:hypothetical protein
MCSSLLSYWSREAFRHELDKFRERVAVLESRIPLDVVARKAFSGLLAMALANEAFRLRHCTSGGSAA